LNQSNISQTQAKANLAAARFNLDKIEAVSDIKEAILDLEWSLKVAEINLQQAIATDRVDSGQYLDSYINSIQGQLDKQEKKLVDLLGEDEYLGTASYIDTKSFTIIDGKKVYEIGGQRYDSLIVEDVRMKQLAVELAQQSVDQSQDVIDQTQKNLNLIQEQLNQATIVAPFDGLIANVNQHAGDFVSAPAALQKPIIYMIDPISMQLEIGVNELDIPKVKLDRKASVSIDAFSGVKLDGKVTAISLLPTIRGGIIDYDVTITFSVPANTDVRIGMNATAAITAE